MFTATAHGLQWKWDGSLTVNVHDEYNKVFSYTISNGSQHDFLRSIDYWLPLVREAATKLYN